MFLGFSTFAKFINFFTADNYLKLQQLGISIFILFVFILFKSIFSKYIIKLLSKLTSKTKGNYDDNMIIAFEKPTKYFIILLGFYLSLKYGLTSFNITINTLNKIFSSGVIIIVAWGFYNLTSQYSFLFEKIKTKVGINVDNIIFPFISKSLRIIIIALTITIVADKWGYNIQGFITGIGLSGLAIALAAQDAAKNMIAGLVLIVDRPFKIGDWISYSEVEGIVEDINFRSTKIRTFGQEIITVPNSNLINDPVTNHTRRNRRKITFNLGVTYNTPKGKLKICVDRIKEMLLEHSGVYKESLMVTFDKFNDSSLDIFIYFFANTIDWSEYLTIKQDVNFKILDILEEEGVGVAFPSSSIYFENELKSIKTIRNTNVDDSYEDDIV